MNKKKDLYFSDFCDLISSLKSLKGKKKLIKVKNFFLEIEEIPKSQFLSFLRLLLCDVDRSRKAYGFKEKSISTVLGNYLCLSKKNINNLQNFTKPKNVFNLIKSFCSSSNSREVDKISRNLTDNFGFICKFLFQKLLKNSGKKLKIDEFDKLLDNLSKLKKKNDKIKIFENILKTIGSEFIDVFVMLIIKELKIGVSYQKILKFWNEDLLEEFNSNFDIKDLSKKFFSINSKRKLKNEKVDTFFRKIKPMLAKREKLENIQNIISENPKNYIYEEKYDGERIICQFNRLENKLQLFSRNCFNVSEIYSSLKIPIFQSIKKEINKIILDGEIIVYDQILDEPAPFGKNKEIALRDKNKNFKNNFDNKISSSSNKNDNLDKERFILIFIIFDILFIDYDIKFDFKIENYKRVSNFYFDNIAQNFIKLKKNYILKEKNHITNLSLFDRYQILLSIFTGNNFRVRLVKKNIIKNFSELMIKFQKLIEENGEGLILKNIFSKYKENKRTTEWMKLKADYFKGLIDTLDVGVIGGYFTKLDEITKNISDDNLKISDFLVGIKLDKKNNNKLIPICRVSNGLTRNDIFDLQPFFKKNYVLFSNLSKKQKDLLSKNFKKKDIPDLIVKNNDKCLVFEMLASEINKTDKNDLYIDFKFSIRFPRFFKKDFKNKT